MMLIITLLTATAATPEQPPHLRCTLVESAGYVDRITPIPASPAGKSAARTANAKSSRDRPANAASGKTSAAGASDRDNGPVVTSKANRPGESLLEVDYLCVDDVVVNPRSSSFDIVLNIYGKQKQLAPGDPAYTVPKPPNIASRLATQLASLFSSVDRGRHSIQPAIVRRDLAGSSCTILPRKISPGPQVILDDEPVYLKWDCPLAARAASVTISTPDKTVTRLLQANLIALLPKRDCPVRCNVELKDSNGARLDKIAFETHGAKALSRDLARDLKDKSPGRALVGATLLQSSGWEVMGASLLLDEACVFPAAAALAITTYQFDRPTALCTVQRPD